MTSASAQIAAKARRLAPFLKSGVVTLQGPQGSGKSALVEELVRLKREEGVRCAAASLDGECGGPLGRREIRRAYVGRAGVLSYSCCGATMNGLVAGEELRRIQLWLSRLQHCGRRQSSPELTGGAG